MINVLAIFDRHPDFVEDRAAYWKGVAERNRQEAERCRGTFSRPIVADPVLNHTELAEKIAEARYWERLTGVRTPEAIEQIIRSWELDR